MSDPSEPTCLLRFVPIVENGDPLVDYLAEGVLLDDADRFRYRRERFMRKGLYDRLVAADAALRPGGHRLMILEGWRAPHIQRRMYLAVERRFRATYPELCEEALREIVETFSAPMNVEVPPPHTTGGAVDLALSTLAGERLDVTAPFHVYDEAAYPFDTPGLDPEIRGLRDVMAEALVGAGVTNYPSEYWHWSYGDQGWAYRGGHPHAHSAAIAPAGWSPDPDDLDDGPLEFVDPRALELGW